MSYCSTDVPAGGIEETLLRLFWEQVHRDTKHLESLELLDPLPVPATVPLVRDSRHVYLELEGVTYQLHSTGYVLGAEQVAELIKVPGAFQPEEV